MNNTLDIIEEPLNSLESLCSLLEKASLGVFIVSRERHLKYINIKGTELLELNTDAVGSGFSLYDLESIFNCGLDNTIDKVLEGTSVRKYDLPCSNHRGGYSVFNLFFDPFYLPDGTTGGVLGIIQDVSESFRRKGEFEEAIYELSIMGQVSEALSSTMDLDKIINIILTGVTANQGLGFNRAFLFLTDESKNRLFGTAAVGPANPDEAGRIWSRLAKDQKTLTDLLNEYIESENNSSISMISKIKDWEISLEDSPGICQAFDDNRAFNIYRKDNLDNESVKLMNHLDTDLLAVAPIISKGHRLGLIAADNRITGKNISDSVLGHLQTFANHAAVAIEKSKLYEDIVKHAAQLEEKNIKIAESQEQILRIEKMSIIGELTSSIAHELRNPLTIIGGFANLMLGASGNEDHSEYLNIIVSEAKRAELVLNQVLDFSKACQTENSVIDFNQLVLNTFELYKTQSKNGRTYPSVNQCKDRLPIWGNRDQLQHALFQIISLILEDVVDENECQIITDQTEKYAIMTIQFDCNETDKTKADTILSQVFNNSLGTQKLSIIVAGETVKYHGGSYGIMTSGKNVPAVYVKLPLKEGV